MGTTFKFPLHHILISIKKYNSSSRTLYLPRHCNLAHPSATQNAILRHNPLLSRLLRRHCQRAAKLYDGSPGTPHSHGKHFARSHPGLQQNGGSARGRRQSQSQSLHLCTAPALEIKRVPGRKGYHYHHYYHYYHHYYLRCLCPEKK